LSHVLDSSESGIKGTFALVFFYKYISSLSGEQFKVGLKKKYFVSILEKEALFLIKIYASSHNIPPPSCNQNLNMI